jgi:hypothetical protein
VKPVIDGRKAQAVKHSRCSVIADNDLRERVKVHIASKSYRTLGAVALVVLDIISGAYP